VPEVRLPELSPALRGGWRFPILHLTLLAFAFLLLLVGGPLGIGSWGIADLRLLAAYMLAALALHAWSTAAPSRPAWARGLAWVLVVAMCIHSGALAQAPLLAALLLLGALDVVVHARHAPPPRLPFKLRAAAGAIAAAAFVGVLLLAVFATQEAIVRLGAAVVLAAALVIACATRPTLRAPQWLLPALGLYYLFFVLAAVPVLPFGPAVAWWLLCGSLFIGALVAARHVSGDDLPQGMVHHQHVVHRLVDPRLAIRAEEVERFLATGIGASLLADRASRATGTPVTAEDLLPELRGGPTTTSAREEREAALRRILGVPT